MNANEVEKKFILGGAVIYLGKMCAVVGMNKNKGTCELEELSGGKTHVDIKTEELEDGD